MPKVPMDYSKTHFYKIVCNDLSIKDCYVGHTLNFVKRQHRHKSSCINESNNQHNLPVYKFIRENGNWDNWCMVKISTECCETRLDALKREREYIEQYKATLNNRKPYITNDEHKILKQKWSEENQEYWKEYRKNNIEWIKDVKQKNYQKNKEQISKKHKSYYEEHKDEIFERISNPCICCCGRTYTYGHKARHLKTKKHQQYLQSLEN